MEKAMSRRMGLPSLNTETISYWTPPWGGPSARICKKNQIALKCWWSVFPGIICFHLEGWFTKDSCYPSRSLLWKEVLLNVKLLIHSQSLSVCRARDLLCYLSSLTLFPPLLSSPSLSPFSPFLTYLEQDYTVSPSLYCTLNSWSSTFNVSNS